MAHWPMSDTSARSPMRRPTLGWTESRQLTPLAAGRLPMPQLLSAHRSRQSNNSYHKTLIRFSGAIPGCRYPIAFCFLF